MFTTEESRLPTSCDIGSHTFKTPFGGSFFYLNIIIVQVLKMKPTPKESKKIHENYEKVVEHLIEEKYTEDREGADNIIAGMSEEWFNLIILK
jgi:hypothetical protein